MGARRCPTGHAPGRQKEKLGVLDLGLERFRYAQRHRVGPSLASRRRGRYRGCTNSSDARPYWRFHAHRRSQVRAHPCTWTGTSPALAGSRCRRRPSRPARRNRIAPARGKSFRSRYRRTCGALAFTRSRGSRCYQAVPGRCLSVATQLPLRAASSYETWTGRCAKYDNVLRPLAARPMNHLPSVPRGSTTQEVVVQKGGAIGSGAVVLEVREDPEQREMG